MGGQIGQRELDAFPQVKIMKLKVLEVADQNIAGTLELGQCVKIRTRLFVCLGEVMTGALLFHQQHTRPEQINEAGPIVQFLHMLLIARDRATADVKDLEEIVIEALRLAFFVMGIRPLAGKAPRPDADLVPGQSHQAGSWFTRVERYPLAIRVGPGSCKSDSVTNRPPMSRCCPAPGDMPILSRASRPILRAQWARWTA